MSIPALAAVSGRVSQIQRQFGLVQPTRSFSQALQSATAATETQPAAFSQQTTFTQQTAFMQPARSTTAIPIGLMGTPVRLTTDNAVVGGAWRAGLPEAGRPWASAIEEAAQRAGLDPRLLAAVVWQESGFEPDAVSKSGAIGLSQLMPATAAELGVDPHDPVANLDGGARFLAWTIEEFGSIELGLAAYNAGPNAVRRANDVGGGSGIPNVPETQAYVPRVIDYYQRLGGVV